MKLAGKKKNNMQKNKNIFRKWYQFKYKRNIKYIQKSYVIYRKIQLSVKIY